MVNHITVKWMKNTSIFKHNAWTGEIAHFYLWRVERAWCNEFRMIRGCSRFPDQAVDLHRTKRHRNNKRGNKLFQVKVSCLYMTHISQLVFPLDHPTPPDDFIQCFCLWPCQTQPTYYLPFLFTSTLLPTCHHSGRSGPPAAGLWSESVAAEEAPRSPPAPSWEWRCLR